MQLRRNNAGHHLTARFDFRAEIGLGELIGEMLGFLSGRRARSLPLPSRPLATHAAARVTVRFTSADIFKVCYF